MRARLRDWLGMRLVRWGLHLIDDRRARWLYRVQREYWREHGEGGR